MTRENGWIRPHGSKLSILFRVLDATVIALTYFIANLWWHGEFGSLETTATATAVIVFHLVAETTGLYATWRGFALRNELLKLWSTWLVVAPVLLFLGFVSKTTADVSRVATVIWFFGAPSLLSLIRVALRLVLGEIRKRGHNTRTTAICGMTALGEQVAHEIALSPWLGLRVIGFFDDRQTDRCHPIDASLGERQGDLDSLVMRARAGEIDVVYIALPLRAEPRIHELVRLLADTTASVYMAADFHSFDLLRARWGTLGDVPVISIHETPFYGVDGWLKRIEDVVLGSVILSIIAVPMLCIAIGVKLSSRGPVFFRQRRYGLNGEVIDVLKFRSMTVMENDGNVKQATKNDTRITPFGAFLRRTSLDELPQFIHVVTGKMSIVRPRPHAVAHNELYRRKIQGYMLRHKVKPGITGWAQVNGWRGETDTLEKMEKRIEHDLEYIRNWDLLWDLEIIWKTVFSRAARSNAY